MTNEPGAAEAAAAPSPAESEPVQGWISTVLRLISAALASSRLTVVLFVAAIGIILIGTLAQVQQGMWEVIDQYFRAWIAWVELKILFPATFFPQLAQTDWDSLPVKSIPFPGGALIGLALVINLTAAHVGRFTVQVRGARLAWGLVVFAAGAVLTWLVIAAGHNRFGVQGEPLLEPSTLWLLIQISLAALWLGCLVAWGYVLLPGQRARKVERVILGLSALGLGCLVAWVFVKGEASVLTDSSMRILYQLIQGQIASFVLLAGCMLLFQKRGGLVLLHGGLGLMMFGEFVVSQYAYEEQMVLQEGQAVSFTRDIRSVELAIVARNAGDQDRVVAVPMSINGETTRFARGDAIQRDELPFDAHAVRYFRNSALHEVRPDETNLATEGTGTRFVADEAATQGSVAGGQTDMASAYIQFVRRGSGEDLGTFLVSQYLASGVFPEGIIVDGAGYGLELRFKRSHKPYQMTLLDVRKDDYVGTNMPRNYSSQVRLLDPSRDVRFETKIWMNNPLRYAGETFYQSGYNVDRRGRESSTLQVVKNTGWMIPYVSCMIVATGILTHFIIVLLRYLRRIQGIDPEEEASTKRSRVAPLPPLTSASTPALVRIAVPVVVVAFCGFWLAGKSRPPQRSSSQKQIEEFGSLPLMYEGRVKPFDTLARNSLRILSNRATFVDASGDKQPAIRWLLDVSARPELGDQHRVIRIDSPDVLQIFGLERRSGFRYAWEELEGGMPEFQKQVALAQRRGAKERTWQQAKLLQLQQRLHRYQLLVAAFRPQPLPPFPSPEKIAENPREAVREIALLRREIAKQDARLEALQPPRAVPVGPPEQPWLVYTSAKHAAAAEQALKQQEPGPSLRELAAAFEAYGRDDATTFNQSVAEYKRLLADKPPAGLDVSMTEFEAYFNHCAPFYHLIPLYVFALVLTAFGWLVGIALPRGSALMRSSTFWLVVFTFAIHTLALSARVMISGRPPVTNLYSSAIFVGWGCVFLGLVLEYVFRLGVGNFVSAVAGIGTLIIAHFLAGDGDTIRVLQAVLDTQFWLTVHVLTVTLGYSATFLAGLLGLLYVAYALGRSISAVVGRGSSSGERPEVERMLANMIYGTVCFAVFFSFIGTVLGGLWADDSWGRFWGWDPKENGALIVVLWNALILHTRWAKLVQGRGLALLAIAGNIVTSWSWFGVNELGIGLHSYGFTEGVARTLLVFWVSQLAVIGVGAIVMLLGSFAERMRGEEPKTV